MPRRNRRAAATRGNLPVTQVMPDGAFERNGVRFSRCATEYASAVADPRGAAACCLPVDPFPMPSSKTKVFVRGSMATGTAGFGFVSMNPIAMAFPPTPASVNSSVIASTASYAGTTVAAGGSGILQNNSNSQYGASQFGSGQGTVQGRVVACGLYAKSTTAPLYASGRAGCVVEPQHDTLDGQGATGLLSYDNACSNAVVPGREYTVLGGPPVVNDEMQFATQYGQGWTAEGGHPIVFWVDGASTTAGQGDTFEYEAWATIEYTGTPVRAKTPSGSDPIGAPAVVAAAQQMMSAPAEEKKSSWSVGGLLSRAAEIVKTGLTWASKMPGPMVAREGIKLIAPEILGVGKNLLTASATTALRKAAVPALPSRRRGK